MLCQQAARAWELEEGGGVRSCVLVATDRINDSRRTALSGAESPWRPAIFWNKWPCFPIGQCQRQDMVLRPPKVSTGPSCSELAVVFPSTHFPWFSAHFISLDFSRSRWLCVLERMYLSPWNSDFQQVTHEDLPDALRLLELLATSVIIDHLAFRKRVFFCLRGTTISHLSDSSSSVSFFLSF